VSPTIMLPEEVENQDVVYIRWAQLKPLTGRGSFIRVLIDDISVTGIEIPTTPSHTLTYTAGENGTIDRGSPHAVDEGEDGTAVTAVPNEGYHFVNWSDAVATATRQDTNVTADISVTANFAINTYTITYDGNGNGGGSAPVDVNNPYDHGSNSIALGQ